MKHLNLLLSIICYIISFNSFAQGLNPQPPIRTIENVPDIQVPIICNLCMRLSYPAPSLEIVENKVCDYYKGQYDINAPSMLGPFPGPILTGYVNFEVWRNKKLEELSLHDSIFSIGAKVYYWLDGEIQGYGFQCGWDDEEARQLLLGLDSKFKFDPNYYINTKTTVRNIETPNRCKVTIINKDITDRIANLLYNYLSKGTQAFDEKVKSNTNFKPLVSKVWDNIQNPIQIDENIWLTINPKELSGGEILVTQGSPQTINTKLGIIFHPKIKYGDKPNVDKTILPPLNISNCSKNIELQPNIKIPFDEIDQYLNDKIHGIKDRNFDFKRRRVIIDSLSTYSSNQKQILKLSIRCIPIKKLTGNIVYNSFIFFFDKIFYKKKGQLFLVATPTFNFSENKIYYPDMDFDINTIYTLKKGADWILKTNIKDYLISNSEIIITEKIKNLENKLNIALKQNINDDASLNGKIDKVSFRNIFVSEDKIVIGLSVSGEIEILVK